LGTKEKIGFWFVCKKNQIRFVDKKKSRFVESLEKNQICFLCEIKNKNLFYFLRRELHS